MSIETDLPPFHRASLRAAIERATCFIGATAPNPPVGAAAMDAAGNLLSVQAHERAGTGHAEAKVIQDLTRRDLLSRTHTLFITLEPCNHHGRTPPCTEAILASGIRRVVYGTADPNPRVAGQGAERLRQAGIEVSECPDAALRAECRKLIQPFAHWAKTGYPWVVAKTAHLADGSMIPPPGEKTFTSPASLRFAHELRKRADAILTGSGTVLADQPEFTVRHVEDHPLVASHQKKRYLVVLDRRGRTPAHWVREAVARGFEVLIRSDLEESLRELGRLGVLETLVEAGPQLSSAVLSLGVWNEHVIITQGTSAADRIEVESNVHWHHPESR